MDVHRAAPVARSAFAATLEQHEALDWDTLGEGRGQHLVLKESKERGPTSGISSWKFVAQ